jgi:hypothetical protein
MDVCGAELNNRRLKKVKILEDTFIRINVNQDQRFTI